MNNRNYLLPLIIILCLFFFTSLLFSEPEKIVYNISVVGVVNNPGVYHISSTSRISTVLSKVGLLENSSQRNIILRRNNDETKIDLQRFYTFGNEKDNPYLFDGDVIFVPARIDEITIIGAVNRSGTYELVNGDRIIDIIELAMGFRTDAYLNKAEIVRFVDDHDSTKTIEVNLAKIIADPECTDNLFLENDDRIFIKSIPEFHKRRELKVVVSGALKDGGEFNLTEGYRVYDAIASAGGLRDDAYLNKAEIVRFVDEHDSTKTIAVNLAKIIADPECEDNLLLENDDRIFIKSIPEFHKRRELKVVVSGALKDGGEFNLTEGYRVYDAIASAGGLRDDAYLPKAEIVRFVDDHDSTKIIAVNLAKIIADPECTDNLFLENDDRIFIRSIPEFHRKRGITISGEVEFPGGYSIDEGKTTLLEILQKCGGPTDKADMKNAFLQRRSREDIVDLEFERLKKMLVEDMTDIEYEYFKTKSRELKGKCAIDFEKLWRENETSILLKHGDFIYIPNKTITVSVSGQVKNPGLITFVPNQNYLYYIEKADGFAWRARKGKIRVIKSSTGEWLKPNKKTIIEVGDMIFIPEKKDYDYWEITKDVMRIAAEIATVVIVIQNVK